MLFSKIHGSVEVQLRRGKNLVQMCQKFREGRGWNTLE